MALKSISDLSIGNAYKEGNDLFLCLERAQNKQARLSGQYRVKRKNMRTGSVTETTYNPTEKVDIVMIEKSKKQYLYDDGSNLVFMDNETYEQIEIPSERLKWELNFLKASDTVDVTTYEGEVLGVTLPAKVVLEITETEPAVKGDTATGATKFATLETGYQIRVPLYMESGILVEVSTETGEFKGKAK